MNWNALAKTLDITTFNHSPVIPSYNPRMPPPHGWQTTGIALCWLVLCLGGRLSQYSPGFVGRSLVQFGVITTSSAARWAAVWVPSAGQS